MRYESKYVILDTTYGGTPVVFSNKSNHGDFIGNHRVLSAGFCCLDKEGKYVCYGRSASLGVDSNPEKDARALNKYLGVTEEILDEG
jgi:hypothetical protein